MLANLAALTAQTQPVDYGYEEGSSIQTAAVAQLVSHLSHHHTRTQPRAAASFTVVTASTYTVLPIASHRVTGDTWFLWQVTDYIQWQVTMASDSVTFIPPLNLDIAITKPNYLVSTLDLDLFCDNSKQTTINIPTQTNRKRYLYIKLVPFILDLNLNPNAFYLLYLQNTPVTLAEGLYKCNQS